jgi:hypothetical protein|tara:strand:- start:3783 stop:3962 length:180 start_codon:yes stop_codon:yes gene_type:complete
MEEKIELNHKMIGKKVHVESPPYSFDGIVDKVVDGETFLVRDLETGERTEASIFDIRAR